MVETFHAQRPRRLALTLTVAGMLVPLAIGFLEGDAATVIGLIAMWSFAGGVILLMRQRTSAGGVLPAQFKWTDLALALAFGVAGALLVPILSLGATMILGETNLKASTEGVPILLLTASILTAAVTEEVLYRAAPIELLLARGTPRWMVILVPWAAFVTAHLGSWNLAHIVGVVVPLGGLLTWLYLWRRNLIVNIIAHALIDAPLVVLALSA